MNHKLLDKLKQLGMVDRKLRRHETVNLLWSTQLGMRLKEDDDVSMWKAPLLKLDGVKEACNVTKDAIFNISDERVKLGMKDTCRQIGSISRCLIVKQLILDFRPIRICSHGDEKVSSTKMSIDGQGILTELLHITCATRKGRRKNGSPAQVVEIGVHICNDSICQALIKLHPKIVLPGDKLTQTLLLSNCPRLTDICLKELASQKEVIGLDMDRANVGAIAKVFFQANSVPAVRVGLIFPLPLWNSRMPSHLSGWKKKDVA